MPSGTTPSLPRGQRDAARSGEHRMSPARATNQANIAAPVRARLLNLAKTQGVDFNQVLARFALERILDRPTRSRHADRFLRKGALLFTLGTTCRIEPHATPICLALVRAVWLRSPKLCATSPAYPDHRRIGRRPHRRRDASDIARRRVCPMAVISGGSGPAKASRFKTCD